MDSFPVESTREPTFHFTQTTDDFLWVAKFFINPTKLTEFWNYDVSIEPRLKKYEFLNTKMGSIIESILI